MIPAMARHCVLTAFAVLALAAVASGPAEALDVMPWKAGGRCAGIVLSGEIRRSEATDAIRRIDAAAARCVTRILVIGKMPGGSVNDAVAIGAAIRAKGYVTAAVPLSQCYSACGLVFLGGTQRYWHEQALFVIHRPRIYETFKDVATEIAAYEDLRGRLSRYVSGMGANADYVDAMYDVAPQDTRPVNPAQLTAWGLFTTVGQPF